MTLSGLITSLACLREQSPGLRHQHPSSRTSASVLRQSVSSCAPAAAVVAGSHKAEGNELLEPAIPQLQEALRVFIAEQSKLLQATNSSDGMLRKLHDFLSVPEGIRSILNVDLDQLHDPTRFAELELPFSEVVVLNDTFRSRQVCLTCHVFRHQPGPNCIPQLACHLDQGLISRGDHLTHRCSGWTEDLHRQRGWAPEGARAKEPGSGRLSPRVESKSAALAAPSSQIVH